MRNSPRQFSDEELEQALVELGTHLTYPANSDVSHAVIARLLARPRPRRWRLIILHPAVGYPLLAVFVLLVALLALSPGTRTTVASWFHLPGVSIRSGSTPPGPLGHNLALGDRLTLSAAQRKVPFHLLVPSVPALGAPDEVYLDASAGQRRVSLLYRSRPAIPRAAATGAGLLISEFQGSVFLAKLIPPGASVEPVIIQGEQGIWLSGRPHIVYYVDHQGKVKRDTIRLAGNVLLWQHSGITLRLEGRLSLPRALQIARSLRVVTMP